MSVMKIFEELGAPVEAVEWSIPYGSDFRRMWNECEHPEFLLPVASGIGVSDWDVVNAAVEVVGALLKDVPLHDEAWQALIVVERTNCGQASREELSMTITTMGRLFEKERGHEEDAPGRRSAYGAMVHLCETIIFAQNREVEMLMSRLSTAVLLAAQARAEVFFAKDSDKRKREAIKVTLARIAPLVRRFIPFESVVAAVVAMTQEGDVYVPNS